MDSRNYRTSNSVPRRRRVSQDPPSSRGQGSGRTTSRSPRTTSYTIQEPSVFQRLLDLLPDNVWVNRAILLVIVLLLIFILFNLVTCIGGAIAGTSSQSNEQSGAAEATATETGTASGQAASADAAATTATTDGQGVESPWTDDGRFSTGDSTLDGYIKKLCDDNSKSGATFDQNAYDTNIYVSRTDYVERDNNQSPWGPTWDVEYAKQYFEEGNSGNCYNFAAVTEYVLKYFGYSDAEAEPCVVALESGSWGDHGLVFVTNKLDGKRCIVDDALSANGWMLDIDSYQYDVRNINQNSTIEGNVDVLNDNSTPTRITNYLTEENGSASAASANGESGEETDSETGENGEETGEYTDEESSEYDESEGDGEYTEEEYTEEEYTDEEM